MKTKRKRQPLMPFRLSTMLRLRNLTKRKLSKMTGICYPMVHRLAAGKANPTWATVLTLAKALNCSPGDFELRRRK